MAVSYHSIERPADRQPPKPAVGPTVEPDLLPLVSVIAP
jgi:hypothetical protein